MIIFLKFLYTVCKRYIENCRRRKKLNYEDIGRNLYGSLVAVIHDGLFDIVIGVYLQSKVRGPMAKAETVSFYLGWTLLISFLLADTFFMTRVLRADFMTLDNKKFREKYGSIYEHF